MRYWWLFILGIVCFIGACQQDEENLDGKRRPTIVCTTGMIGDMTTRLVADSAEVITLMGPGVDPHLYKASQGDISKLSSAKVVVYNGLHLEGKMTEIFEKLKSSRPVIEMTAGLNEDQLINSSDYAGAHDPHIWFDVRLWKEATIYLASELKSIFPHWSEMIEKNLDVLTAELNDLDAYCESHISLIPEQQRVLITAHDAFKYFGKRYQIEVMGLQGISTASEYGLRDISNLVSFITDRKIQAIFIESSVPRRSIEAVVEGCLKRGHKVKIGGELYSDALGASEAPEGTYIGMVKHNVETITEALTGNQ